MSASSGSVLLRDGVGKPGCLSTPSTAPRRRADLSGAFFIAAVLERSLRVVAADAAWPVKDGVRAVGIDVDLDPRLDEMGPHRAFGDLQFERPVGLLNFPCRPAAPPRRTGSRRGRRPGSGVKAEPSPGGTIAKSALWSADRSWMKALAASTVGYSVEPQLLGQSILQRLERPLGATSSLRRIGPDVLDPQVARAPARPASDEPRSISPPAFGGVKIMRAAVRIEAHRQAVLRENLVQRPEGRGRALLLDQKRRIDRARRVIERHDQIERHLALEPVVPRAVLMQHHARQRPPLALSPMRPLARRLRQQHPPIADAASARCSPSRSRGPSPDARGNA